MTLFPAVVLMLQCIWNPAVALLGICLLGFAVFLSGPPSDKASVISFLRGHTSPASVNSCSNVDVLGLFDQSGLTDNDYYLQAAGTFRITGEENENKQPDFNLNVISCEKHPSDPNASLECKVTTAALLANSDKPNPDNPNCELDLEFSTYPMKELQKGILTGIETSTGCYNTMLTIDRNTKRVYLSFTRTTYADNYGKMCGNPRTQVLMNCTGWPKSRKQKQGQTLPPRYCDFSGSSDK
jgi:hypothetical protein